MENKIKIIIADHNQQFLDKISDLISSLGYTPLLAATSDEVLQRLESNNVNLIIVDSILSSLDGYQLCKMLKTNPDYAFIPIIILTSITDDQKREESLESNADFFINKPIDMMILECAVKSLLKLNFLNNSLAETQKLLTTLVEKLEDKNEYTKGHSKRVREFSLALAKKLGLMEWDLQTVSLAATFHNIGYIFIDDKLLEKKLPDNSDEKKDILKHSLYGEEMCKAFSSSSEFLNIIRHHHEHYDGSGYPEGLKTDDIPIGSRIIAITEAYVAMTSRRPYREKMNEDDAQKILMLGAGNFWDPFLVKEFLKLIKKV